MMMSVDYKGRGTKASQYSRFIFEELLPSYLWSVCVASHERKSLCRIFFGRISALDIVWNNPGVFQKVGVFSGSLWWRIKDRAEKDFNENNDRLMHRQIRKGITSSRV